MKPSGFLTFARRNNLDGTADSICPRCFQTIATVNDEAEFSRLEREHVCDPHVLERLQRGIGKIIGTWNKSANR